MRFSSLGLRVKLIRGDHTADYHQQIFLSPFRISDFHFLFFILLPAPYKLLMYSYNHTSKNFTPSKILYPMHVRIIKYSPGTFLRVFRRTGQDSLAQN